MYVTARTRLTRDLINATYLLTYLDKAKFIAGPHRPVTGKQTAF